MDIVLIGNGISAILLAESLARRRCFRTLRIVGPRAPLRAHRLSYWNEIPTPFDSFAEASWSRLSVVSADGEEIPVSLERYRYRTFHPHDWIAAARARLSEMPGVEWVDARVEEITPSTTGAVVRFGTGSLAADWVFSSARLSGFQPSCWQRFEGWEIEVQDDVFEPPTPTLLDFRTPPAGDFRFVYLLPLAGRRLFIEHVSYQPCDHARAMRAYLREALGLRSWIVLDREHGATATFRDRPRREQGHIVHIGVAAGLAKPVTGYALLRMWRDAESIAKGLEEEGRPIAAAAGAGLYRVADHFFVDQVRDAPLRLNDLVPAIFRGASGDAVLGFLDDRATPREQLAVALATPRWLRWLLRGS